MPEVFSRTQLIDHLTRAMVGLGDNADDVATVLEHAGHTGKLCNECNCPIAHWATAVAFEAGVTGAVRVKVTTSLQIGFRATGAMMAVSVVVPFTGAVRDFIEGFDTYRYPQLVAS